HTRVRRRARNVPRPELIGCYPTFSRSVSAATGGAARVRDTMTPQELTNADLQSDVTASLVLIGIDYFGTGYSGMSASYSDTATCSASNIVETNYVGDDLNT